MCCDPEKAPEAGELRRRAEETIKKKHFAAVPPEQVEEVYHELLVHQVELEFQNQELRRVQSELEASRESYFDLYNLAPVGYFTLNAQGEILEANLTAAALLGRERRVLSGKRLGTYIVTEDFPRFLSNLKALFESGRPQTWTMRMQPRGAPWFWGRFEASLNQTGAGKPLCRMVMSDINAQVQAELAVSESQERLRFVLETSKTGTWDLDLDDRRFFHSPEHDQIFGYSEPLPEWTYSMLLQHIEPQDREAVTRSFHRAVSTRQPWSFECRIRRADAEIRWISFHGRFYTASPEGRTHLTGIVQDITERTETRRALEASEERFQAFMAHFPGPAFIQDNQGNRLYSNVPAPSELEAMFGEHAPAQARQENQQVLRSGTPLTQVLSLPSPEGPPRHWLLTRFPVKTPGAAADLLGAIALDVTEQIQTEERLEAALGEETVLKREIHHRVKNSLQVVISLLFIQSLHTADPALREILLECQTRTRAIALIYELLSEENMSNISFAAYAKQLATDLSVAYQGSSGRIRLQIHSLVPSIDVDTALPCGLILTELLSNSFKHAFPNNATGEIRVELSAREGEGLELTVADNGVGPPPGVSLASASTVGLSLVRDLVWQLGGSLEFQMGAGVSARIVWQRRKFAPGRR